MADVVGRLLHSAVDVQPTGDDARPVVGVARAKEGSIYDRPCSLDPLLPLQRTRIQARRMVMRGHLVAACTSHLGCSTLKGGWVVVVGFVAQRLLLPPKSSWRPGTWSCRTPSFIVCVSFQLCTLLTRRAA
eukprot:2863618-Amphidinium_carterae.1